MASARYVPDEAGFREMALGPELLAACVAVAKRGQAFAEAISPRVTNEYAEGFDVAPVSVVIGTLPRAAARLENSAPHAAAVEFGNEHSPNAHRVLGRTGDVLERLR